MNLSGNKLSSNQMTPTNLPTPAPTANVPDTTADTIADAAFTAIATTTGMTAQPLHPAIASQVAKQSEIVREEERARISREIHDELGGNLAAIKIALALLIRDLPAQPALTEKAAYLDSLVDRTISAIHHLTDNLRPGVLDFGLVPAVAWQVQEFRKQTGIECTLHVDMDAAVDTDADADRSVDLDGARQDNDDALALPEQLSLALFRIVQESFTNIIKHARASQVHVSLVADQHTVRLRIADNGCGYRPANPDRTHNQTLGISGMKQRVASVEGSFTITANDGGGTVVAVEAPR